MLLRVTQVSGGNAENHPVASAEPPLHACLATAENNEAQSSSQSATQATSVASIAPGRFEASGQILTVGRKNCTVTLDDKCVSRRHASIRLLADRRHHSSQSNLSQSFAGMVEFGRPESKEEIAACATSKMGVICVVKDCGSKFGTFVSVRQDWNPFLKEADDYKQSSNGDGEETGDETDDEAGEVKPINFVDLTEKQSRAARMLHDDGDSNGSLPNFLKLEPNSSSILLPLSHFTHKQNAHVTILFGPQGSGIRIVLLPLQFTFSRFSAKDQDRLLTRLHTIGATHSPQWDVLSSTHLVTKEAKATAKHIMAWACCKPAVTEDYVLALLTRKNARDAMPNEEDYLPPGNSQLTDKLDQPCVALRGYTIAVLVEDDSAPLALSAGADVLLVYQCLCSEKEFRPWWEERCLRAANEKKALVVMETNSRKATSWMKWLTALQCRFTNQKNLAKAITSREENVLLMDVNKKPIEKLVGWDEEKEDMVVEWGEGVEEELQDEGFAAVVQDDDDATENEDEDNKKIEEMPVSTRRSKRSQEVAQEVSVEQVKKKTTDEGSRARSKRLEESDIGNPKLPSESEKVDENQPNDAPGSQQAVLNKNRSKSKNVTKSTNTIINEDESCDESLPDERIPLPVTEDGWFVAAPAARKKYRKRIDIDEADGEEQRPKSAAKTARVSGLIVREYLPPPPRPSSRRNGSKKDFKRFRKNQVIRGFASFSNRTNALSVRSVPEIRMVSVLPKESERQRQLEMQQQELDRDQAFADALFNDGGGGRGGGRGRSGGSIAGMFSQSTSKRGRGRR